MRNSILVILDLDVIEELGQHDKIGDPSVVEQKEQTSNAMEGSEFYGVKKEETKSQIQQSIPSRGAAPPAGSVSDSNIYPIEGLSPFAHKWTIKARVTLKSEIRTWHKATGEGRLFSVNLLDESGEIKATGFNEQCDAFYELLQEGSVYYIYTPCRVTMANKKFTTLPNDYELTFERDTKIEKAEDQASVPQVRFNFCNIQELQGVEKDNTVDLIGVLKTVGEVNEFTSKSGTPFSKRDLEVVDDTGFQVRVTIWGKTANAFDAQLESIIAFKGTKVSDFDGKSLSLLSSGTMTIDPDIPDAHRLKGWYDSAGRPESFATHKNMSSMAGATGRKDELKTIAQVKEENLGIDEQAYYSVHATIVFVKQDTFCYPACAKVGCNKKVVDNGDNTWRCEVCNINHDKPEYRYILNINVADHTGQQYLSCFDETGRAIVGMSADDAMELRENDSDKFTKVFEDVNCKKLYFRCKAKMDNFQDQQR